jgi:hypothetical protein
MEPLDIVAIERRARALRAAEIRRVEGLIAERMRVWGRLLAQSALDGLLLAAKALQPLFSWNPQAVRPAKPARAARPASSGHHLLDWNPEVRHHL